MHHNPQNVKEQQTMKTIRIATFSMVLALAMNAFAQDHIAVSGGGGTAGGYGVADLATPAVLKVNNFSAALQSITVLGVKHSITEDGFLLFAPPSKGALSFFAGPGVEYSNGVTGVRPLGKIGFGYHVNDATIAPYFAVRAGAPSFAIGTDFWQRLPGSSHFGLTENVQYTHTNPFGVQRADNAFQVRIGAFFHRRE